MVFLKLGEVKSDPQTDWAIFSVDPPHPGSLLARMNQVHHPGAL